MSVGKVAVSIRQVGKIALLFAFTLITATSAYAVCKKKTNGFFKKLKVAEAAVEAAVPAQKRTAIKGIAAPLTSTPGNADRGRKLAINRRKGNCLACHRVSKLKSQLFHGEIGPKLDGVGRRYPDSILRQLIVDSTVYYPKTLMPSFYMKPNKLHDVARRYRGKTILSAQEVEDIIAFMKTL